MRIAITGASGFIGKELTGYLSIKHQVIALQRNITQKQTDNIEYRKFDLNDEATFSSVCDADVLIHCAFIKLGKENPDSSQRNISTTLKLAEICNQKNIHYIFLSTMSAHSDSLSEYGKHKLEIEQLLDSSRSAILKLGLVIGASGGLFNTISQAISKSSVVPIVDGGFQPIQTVHITELCKLIEKIAVQRIAGIYHIGTPKVYTLKYLYEQIAAKRGKQVKFVSLPFWLMKMMLSITETIGLNLPVSTENLLGLKQLKAFDTASDLNKLGCELLSLEQALKL